MSRRQALGLGLLGFGLTGCGIDWTSVRLDTAGSPTAPELTADMLARFAAVETITVLRLQAQGLGSAEGDLVAAAHETQLGALGELPAAVPSGSVTPSGWPTTVTGTAAAVDAGTLATSELAAAVAILPAADLTDSAARLLTSVATSLLAAADLLDDDLPGPTDLPAAPAGLSGLDPEAAPAPLQAVADAEDVAGFAYATFAAGLSGSERARAVTLMGAHRDRALQVRALADSGGVALVAAPAAYQVSTPPNHAALIAACADAERACAIAAAGLFSVDGDGVRALAQALLLAAGRAQSAWVPLPALPGLE